MAKITYNKLVRDRIPEIIHLAGKQCETTVMNEVEYRQSLLDKLVEEAQEVQGAVKEDLATELADILEVVDAILQYMVFRSRTYEMCRLPVEKSGADSKSG